MKFFVVLLLLIVRSLKAELVDEVFFEFYGDDINDKISFDKNNAASDFPSIASKYFDPARKNFIFSLGWQPTSSDPSVVINAYLNNRRSEYNIINLNWSAYAANINPFPVAFSMPDVVETASKILEDFGADFDLERTHITGFSLGSHIAGGIGNHFNGNVERITGCDPGGLFNTLQILFPTIGVHDLVIEDAKFVDVIQTNADGLGDRFTTGHANFWPSNELLFGTTLAGTSQPGCLPVPDEFLTYFEEGNWAAFTDIPACSHFRSIFYYAESVGREDVFNSETVCQRIFSRYLCDPTAYASMGYHAKETFNDTGEDFYLVVNPAPAYSQT